MCFKVIVHEGLTMENIESQDVTAYSLYSVQQKERTKINPLKDLYPDLPCKKICCYICRSAMGLWWQNAI